MNWKKYAVIAVVVVCMFTSVLSGVIAARKVVSITGDVAIESEAVDEVPVFGHINILFLGSDNNTLTDTIMIVSIDGQNKKVNILSIPRDTRIAFGNHYERINAATEIGRQEVAKGNYKQAEDYTIKKIKEVTGLPIHYFVAVDLKVMKEVIDVLGGVDFDVPDVEGKGRGMNYDDPAQNLHIHLKPGLQHLDGNKAEQFLRYRKGNGAVIGYAEGDIGRMRAQQDFIKTLAAQKLQPQYISKIDEIFETIKGNLRTNYTTLDLAQHVLLLATLKGDDVQTFELPGEPQYIKDAWYYIYFPQETEKLVNEHFRYSDIPASSPEQSEEPAE